MSKLIDGLDPDKFEYDMLPVSNPASDEEIWQILDEMGDEPVDAEDLAKFRAWKASRT